MEAESFGHFSKEIALNEVSKPVGIIASFFGSIRTFVMVSILVFAQRYSWLQLICFLQYSIFELMFVFYFKPYGKNYDGNGTVQQKNAEFMQI